MSIVLGIHIGAAIVGFILSGVLSVIILKEKEYAHLSAKFWLWERITQWVTVLLGVAGAVLYLSGRRPTDALHLLYGALALLAVILLGAFGRDRDPQDILQGWRINPKWLLFAMNVFLWAMYGRGLTTGFFGF